MPQRKLPSRRSGVSDVHQRILQRGVKAWNVWRSKNPSVEPHLEIAYIPPSTDFRGADFSGASLGLARFQDVRLDEANFTGAKLWGAFLMGASLDTATLSGADLTGATLKNTSLKRAVLKDAVLYGADLSRADLTEARLQSANLANANLTLANLTRARLKNATMTGAVLSEAVLDEADLSDVNLFQSVLDMARFRRTFAYRTQFNNANLFHVSAERSLFLEANFTRANLHGAQIVDSSLEYATLVETDFSDACLTNAAVYGVSAWGLTLTDMREQLNLRVTPTKEGESAVCVDNLEIAQFVYLLLNNEKIRGVIDTIGQKGVLILGRFIPERKAVLDALRQELRRLGYVPMVFDFERPTQRDFTETIKTLAGLSRFIVADITNPRSSPLELQATVPDYMVPFVPIIDQSESPFAMFADLQQKYDWVLDVLQYDSVDGLIGVLQEAVVKPALVVADKLAGRKAQELRTRHVRDYRT